MSYAPSVTGRSARDRAVILSVYALGFFVALPGLLATFGLRLDALLRLPALGGGWRPAGLGLVAVGAAGVVGTMLHLGRTGRGWPVSHLPPADLVPTGPYARMRHPIYVGYTLALVGAGLAAGSAGIACGSSALLAAGWLVYVLGFEEPKLRRRFGRAYDRYRERVPLLPLPGRRIARRAALRVWKAVRPTAERLANRPVLARIGPTVWVSYGAFMGGGTVLGLWLLAAPLLAGGVAAAAVARYVVLLALAMLVGGRLAWLAYEARRLLADPAGVLRTVGFVSWGAIAVGVAVPFAYAPTVDVPPLWLVDCTLLGLAACGVIGRVGCLTYGCCFGRRSDHGLRWNRPEAKVNRLRDSAGGEGADGPRVPTQLIEAVWLSVVLLAALALVRRGVSAGAVGGAVLLLYAVGRLATDCLRDERRFGGWRLTAGQVGSLASAGAGMALLFAAKGPSPWPAGAPWTDLGLAPGAGLPILAAGLVVFLATSFHWREVGRW